MSKLYKLTIYFIGGTVFSTTFNNMKEVNKFQNLLENKKILKKYNNIIRTGNELEGINIANMNAYQITEINKEDKQ